MRMLDTHEIAWTFEFPPPSWSLAILARHGRPWNECVQPRVSTWGLLSSSTRAPWLRGEPRRYPPSAASILPSASLGCAGSKLGISQMDPKLIQNGIQCDPTKQASHCWWLTGILRVLFQKRKLAENCGPTLAQPSRRPRDHHLLCPKKSSLLSQRGWRLIPSCTLAHALDVRSGGCTHTWCKSHQLMVCGGIVDGGNAPVAGRKNCGCVLSITCGFKHLGLDLKKQIWQILTVWHPFHNGAGCAEVKCQKSACRNSTWALQEAHLRSSVAF